MSHGFLRLSVGEENWPTEFAIMRYCNLKNKLT